MQCPHCNAEWNLSNSQSQQIINTCPFCGESLIPEEKPDTDTFGGILRSLVLERGTELYKSEKSQQLKSLLSDMAVNFQKERKTLDIAIMEGVPSRLLSYDGKSDKEKQIGLYEIVHQLGEDCGMSKERAIETVNYLATGLGWKVQLEVKKEEPTTSETPQASSPATPQASKSPNISKLKNWIVKTGNFIKKDVKIILVLLVIFNLIGIITILSMTIVDTFKIYEIGDIGPGGGIIFYHSPSGFNVIQADGSSKLCHYLEVSKVDLGRTTWCVQSGLRGGGCNIQTEESLGYGKINTLRIIKGKHEGGKLTTENCAALACHKYRTESTKDGEWFLPSRDELDLLYKNLWKKVIESNTTGSSWYWSSSEGTNFTAWSNSFIDGYQSNYHYKYNTNSIRAVRAF
jgi:hypothetical protein